MATQETITERYWTWCDGWFGIPYPCRKIRTVTKWCYEFSEVKVTKWGLYCQYVGCEHGISYKWSDWSCFGIGTGYVYGVTRCFSSEKTRAGTC